METRITLNVETNDAPTRVIPVQYRRGSLPDAFDDPLRALLKYYGSYDLLIKMGMLPKMRNTLDNDPLAITVTEDLDNGTFEVEIEVNYAIEITITTDG